MANDKVPIFHWQCPTCKGSGYCGSELGCRMQHDVKCEGTPLIELVRPVTPTRPPGYLGDIAGPGCDPTTV